MDPCPTPRPGHLRGTGPGYEIITNVPCARWECPRCGIGKAFKLRKRMEGATYNRFITLTHKPTPGETPNDALRKMRHDWAILCKRLQRVNSNRRIGFVCVVEWTAAGQPHLHILAQMPYIHQRRLSGAWKAIHGAPIVDIRKAKPGEGAAKYLAKYLTKGLTTPKRLRRWSSTRAFLPVLPPYISDDYIGPLSWEYLPQKYEAVIRRAHSEGYNLIGYKDAILISQNPRGLEPAPPLVT